MVMMALLRSYIYQILTFEKWREEVFFTLTFSNIPYLTGL